MAISTFLQQLESELVDKPEAQLVVAHYRPKLEQADAAGDKDKLILLQDQMYLALANTLNQAVDPVTSVDPTTLAIFMGRIEGLIRLSPSEKMKLTKMVDGYALSLAIAKEMDPTLVAKPTQEVLQAFLELSPTKLSDIVKFSEPTLIVTPKNTLDEKKVSMDANKKYEEQDDAFIWEDPKDSPYRAIKPRSSMSISVVDGAPHMGHIDGISPSSKFSDRREKLKAHYEKKNMKLINSNEYAMLMQRSLHLYEQSADKDPTKIVDFYKSETDPVCSTITCFDDSDLAGSPHVACGCFGSGVRRVNFNARSADSTNAGLRGRPSVQVM